MTEQIQISIDPDVYERLQLLMVPPISDANAAIKELLEYEGHPSPAFLALGARERHYTMDEEFSRAMEGVYEGGGNT